MSGVTFSDLSVVISFIRVKVVENFVICAVILKLYQFKVFATPLYHLQQWRGKEKNNSAVKIGRASFWGTKERTLIFRFLPRFYYRIAACHIDCSSSISVTFHTRRDDTQLISCSKRVWFRRFRTNTKWKDLLVPQPNKPTFCTSRWIPGSKYKHSPPPKKKLTQYSVEIIRGSKLSTTTTLIETLWHLDRPTSYKAHNFAIIFILLCLLGS